MMFDLQIEFDNSKPKQRHLKSRKITTESSNSSANQHPAYVSELIY